MNAQEETGILSARRPWALDVARVGVVESRDMPDAPVTEHTVKTERHSGFHLAAPIPRPQYP